MIKKLLLKTLNESIIHKRRNKEYERLYNEGVVFEKYLNKSPYDTDMWIARALFYYKIFDEEVGAYEALNKVFEYDLLNINAVLLYGYVKQHLELLDKETFDKLNVLKTKDLQFMSLIEYEKSWYYQRINEPELRKKALLKSIEYCDEFVNNYYYLGLSYRSEHKIEASYYYMEKALKNVRHVYAPEDIWNHLDIEEFFNERLRGIHLSAPNFETLLSYQKNDLARG